MKKERKKISKYQPSLELKIYYYLKETCKLFNIHSQKNKGYEEKRSKNLKKNYFFILLN